MRIVNPRTEKTMHVSQVTKTQLAQALNEQGGRLRALEEQVRQLGRALIAITQEPEAFQFQDGRVRIAGAALAKVKPRTELTMDTASDGTVTLALRLPDAPRLEAPHIIVPGQEGRDV